MIKRVLIAIMFLLIVSSVYAAVVTTTEMTIQTKPDHNLAIKVTDAETGAKVQDFSRNSSSTGEVKFLISSMGIKDLNVEVAVSKNEEEIHRESYGPYSIKNSFVINILLEKKEESKNESSQTTQQNITQQAGVTTQATLEGGENTNILDFFKKNGKYFIYVLIAMGVLAGLFFGGRFVIQQKGFPKGIVVKKQSDLLKELKEEKVKEDIKTKEATELEKKLQALQAEFNKLKNREKIAEVEKKLEEDRKLLEKLKKGEES